MNARALGEDALMVAARIGDVDDLNLRARQILLAEGYLGPDHVALAGRSFAPGDDVLALRNDYRLGILNGTRATIERIDAPRRQLLATSRPRPAHRHPLRLRRPGHLTHGYATTIHKAQGATVDRCFVLIDTTASREHAYTALSRGRHRNELYLVSNDHRLDERHALEHEADPLDALRGALRRSGAKHLALDQSQHAGPPVANDPRQERDRLRAQLAERPENPTWALRRLYEERSRVAAGRDNAIWRRDNAQQELDDLGPIGRRTRRSQRRDAEDRIVRCTGEIARHDTQIAAIDQRTDGLTPEIREWSTWSRHHAEDLSRLDLLERQIQLSDRLEHSFSRSLVRSAEISRGLEL